MAVFFRDAATKAEILLRACLVITGLDVVVVRIPLAAPVAKDET